MWPPQNEDDEFYGGATWPPHSDQMEALWGGHMSMWPPHSGQMEALWGGHIVHVAPGIRSFGYPTNVLLKKAQTRNRLRPIVWGYARN